MVIENKSTETMWFLPQPPRKPYQWGHQIPESTEMKTELYGNMSKNQLTSFLCPVQDIDDDR